MFHLLLAHDHLRASGLRRLRIRPHVGIQTDLHRVLRRLAAAAGVRQAGGGLQEDQQLGGAADARKDPRPRELGLVEPRNPARSGQRRLLPGRVAAPLRPEPNGLPQLHVARRRKRRSRHDGAGSRWTG